MVTKYLAEAEERLRESAHQRRAFALHAAEQARSMYRNQRADAVLAELWSLITRRSRQLHSLADLDRSVRARHTLGVRTIPLAQVLGTEGRSGDFDGAFRPAQEHTRARWVSVATAMIQGLAIPPIEVIQAGERYYVRDGHHRVSVARALGQADIDAVVTVWLLNVPPVAELAGVAA